MASHQKSNKREQENILSKREIEIVRLIMEELDNRAIAKKLFISKHTVETHRKNIFRKTQAKTIVGLIKYAYKNKLINTKNN